MKTLTIKDLARTEELGSKEMAAVRGGWKMNTSYYKVGDVNIGGTYDSSIFGMQSLKQDQSILTATANESAFLEGVSVHGDASQNGKNKIAG